MARLHLKSTTTNARAMVRASIRAAATQQRAVRGEPAAAEQAETSFDDALSCLDATEVAEEVEVTLPHKVTYLFDVSSKDGKRYNQRFYAPGLLIRDSNGVVHDGYFEVYPRFERGYIVDPALGDKSGITGTLVVSAMKGVSVFKHTLVRSETSTKLRVKREFAITPKFVSFNGKPAVPENPEDAAEEAVEDAE